MNSKGGCNEINKRRLVANPPLAKKFSLGNVTTPSVRFNTTPVIGALKYVLTVFSDLQLDYNQTAVLS